MSKNMAKEKYINNFLYKKNGIHVNNDFEELIDNVDKAFDFSKLDNSVDNTNDEEKINNNLNIENSYINYGSNIILVPEKSNNSNIKSSFIKNMIGNYA